jgi:hypothetical protein
LYFVGRQLNYTEGTASMLFIAYIIEFSGYSTPFLVWKVLVSQFVIWVDQE